MKEGGSNVWIGARNPKISGTLQTLTNFTTTMENFRKTFAGQPKLTKLTNRGALPLEKLMGGNIVRL